MIPSDVDIAAVTTELADDGVFVGEEAIQRDQLIAGLRDVVAHADAAGVGPMRVAVIDQMPEHTSDLRDIADALLASTDANLVLVRNPESGAIVSGEYSRAAIEAAQYYVLNDPDYVRSANFLIDQLAVSNTPWGLVFGAIIVAVIVVIGVAWVGFSHLRCRTV
ncbi:MAG: DUF6676 family protein [Corynebacterium sp.]|nr:DUF6676 family protein [Corynebacterium sp.]